MKILVTGALGYIGTQFIYNMRHSQHTLVGIDNSQDAIDNRLAVALQYNKNFSFYKKDILDDLSEYNDVDMIVHLAAEVGYVACDDNPGQCMRTNVEGTKSIAQLDKPTVFLSTGSVYGKLDQPCVETLECNPATLYAKSKLEGEQIIKEIKDWTILRPATAYGLSFKMRHDLLIHTLCRDAVKSGFIQLYQPKAERTFYHVNDLANTLCYIVDNFKQFKSNIFNIGAEHLNITKEAIVKEIQKHIDLKLEIVEDEDRDKRDYYVDYSKQNQYFKVDSKLDISGIIKYYQGY